jgi:D-arabinose 1-dehydrogenase-like Zn-dependent alcohol dehydrogenase
MTVLTGYAPASGTVRPVSRSLPSPAPHEVLVRVSVAGICGSDLKALAAGATGDVVAGHEGAGVVVAVGERVTTVAPGTEVLIYSYEGCRECASCAGGEPKFCRDARATSVGRDGTWASHVLIAATSCLPIPSGMDSADGAVLACTGGTAGAAVLKAGDAIVRAQGARALVVGAGPLGCAVAQLLHGCGVAVDAMDLNARRLAFGADRGWLTAIEAADDGAYPLVVETSGSGGGRQSAVLAAAHAATVVLVGLGASDQALPVEAVIRRELRLVGAHFWTLGALPEIVELYRRGGSRPAAVVGGEYSLAELPEACAAAPQAPGKLIVRTAAA